MEYRDEFSSNGQRCWLVEQNEGMSESAIRSDVGSSTRCMSNSQKILSANRANQMKTGVKTFSSNGQCCWLVEWARNVLSLTIFALKLGEVSSTLCQPGSLLLFQFLQPVCLVLDTRLQEKSFVPLISMPDWFSVPCIIFDSSFKVFWYWCPHTATASWHQWSPQVPKRFQVRPSAYYIVTETAVSEKEHLFW